MLGLGSSIPAVVVWGLESTGVIRNYNSSVLISEYAAFTALFVPLIPSLLFPQRETIHAPSGVEVALDCYREGYKRRATLKNAVAAAAGELAGLMAFMAIAVLVTI